MAERKINQNILFNSSDKKEDAMGKATPASLPHSSEHYNHQHNILPKLKPIPNYGKLYWEFSHPEQPLDLNTLPGYENIVYHKVATKPTSGDDAPTAKEICSTEIEKEALNIANPTTSDKALPAFRNTKSDSNLLRTKAKKSLTFWQNTNKLANSIKRENETTMKLLRNHPFITPKNLHSMAAKRLNEFNLKPGHVIKFVYYGLGILNPKFSSKTFSTKDSYTCLDCSNKFFCKNEFQCHSLSHSGSCKSILCTLCSKDFWYMHQLIRHSHNHSISQPFECGFCGNKFKRRDSLIVHLMNIHNFEVSHSERRKRDYICPECYVVCETNTILEIHMDDIHQVQECFEMKL